MSYRTSQQTRARVDRLLPGLVADVDGSEENRRNVVSPVGGRQPRGQGKQWRI